MQTRGRASHVNSLFAFLFREKRATFEFSNSDLCDGSFGSVELIFLMGCVLKFIDVKLKLLGFFHGVLDLFPIMDRG